MSEVCLITAMDSDGLIGTDGGGLPWRSAADLAHFKKTTLGCPVIFGKTTYFAMPNVPLKDRLNIVVSHGYAPVRAPAAGHLAFSELESALDFTENFRRVFICGGAAVYEYALARDLVDKVYLTEVWGKFEGQVYFPIKNFPAFLKKSGWRLEEKSDLVAPDGEPPLVFSVWAKDRSR